ncbi:hypothetical protein LMG29542_06904 [Paraburkholderia humisilvae]|uniref:Uncharacterized protein n=1 Tax=Paraburkholderia humisilvae TaxID=627669 RepID=A0A6J5F5Z1_9BURK|nr:hypothetical protein LMG29542_06904 [Paraburkholderia humisilvae]
MSAVGCGFNRSSSRGATRPLEYHSRHIYRCRHLARTRACGSARGPGVLFDVSAPWSCECLVRAGTLPFQVDTVSAQDCDDQSARLVKNGFPLLDGGAQTHHGALARQPEQPAHIEVTATVEQLPASIGVAQYPWTHVGRPESDRFERLAHHRAQQHIVDHATAARRRKEQRVAGVRLARAFPP